MTKPRNMSKSRWLVLLTCREACHEWHEHLRKIRDAGWGRHRTMRCEGCGCERIELININGEISNRHYDYPDDYGLVSCMSKQEARAEKMRVLNGGMKKEGIKAELSKRRDGRANLKAVS